jgi:radical SAM protein with 4Fe4S-binding SPASM domain
MSQSPGSAAEGPKRIILELSRQCGAKCPFCALVYDRPVSRFMEKDLAMEVMAAFPSALETCLFGYGESLEHPQFGRIFGRIAELNRKTYLLTNGYHLNKFAELLVEKHLDFLAVSLDSVDESHYKQLRPGLELKKVLENLSLVDSMKIKYGRTDLKVRVVAILNRFTAPGLRETVEVISRLGVSEFKLVDFVAHSEADIRWSFCDDLGERDRIIENIRSHAENYGLDFIYPHNKSELDDPELPHNKCRAALNDLFVSSDGSVRPCMIFPDPIVDLKSTPIKEVWNSPAMSQFRRNVDTQNMAEQCRSCWQSTQANKKRPDALVSLAPKLAGRRSDVL